VITFQKILTDWSISNWLQVPWILLDEGNESNDRTVAPMKGFS
jgi:hypothetical protein